jgi:AraC-like DNA-binding protein
MERILNAQKYTLIFFDPDIILHGFVDGNLCVYQDKAEEFAKSFFSEDIMSKEYNYEKELLKAKQWLVGVLYHERGNSITEIKDLTGYKSSSTLQEAIKKFGPLRSNKEGAERAFKKRYGMSMSAFMVNKWKNMDSAKRREMGKAASKGLRKYWSEKKLMVKS